jgi:hypothetical protein
MCFKLENYFKDVCLSKETIFLYDSVPIGKILRGTSALDLSETEVKH